MPSPRRIIDLIADIWREMRRLMLVLWLCRVSTISALLALGLAFLPQVQDLYTEITYYKTPTPDEHFNTISLWALFYGLCFLWAFTVHYCARTVLSFETWPLKQSDETDYAYWVEAVPRYLGWVCILAIFIGQINALKNLQIDDDLIARTASFTYITPLIITLAIIIIIQTATRKLGRSAIVISAIAIAYWIITASDIYFNTSLADHYRMQVLHNLALPVVTILWGCLFYWFVAERRRLLNWLASTFTWPHHLMLRLTRTAASLFPVQIRPMHNQQTRETAPKFLPFRKHGLFHFEAPSENVRGLMLGLFSLTIVMALWLSFAIADPGDPPFGFSRALLLPVLLGIWVPLLTTITFLSNQIRFPLLTMFVIAGVGLSWFIGDNHDIELAAPLIAERSENPKPNFRDKMPLKTAVEIWMKHHNCETTPRACPPPLIIAASGGASRSAFYVTTVLGELMDKPALFWPKTLPANKSPKSAREVASQIFAISSVSGGSLGSALFAATLKGRRARLFGQRPCNARALREDKLLFSVPEAVDEKLAYPNNWKNCLQAMAAGDFLSPAMISFAFRDNLAVSSLIGMLTGTDRAKSLEAAWTERAGQLTGRRHLDDALLTFQPTIEHWMPLLLLNGTSVTTGKRLIATALKTTYTPADKLNFAPVVTAYDPFEQRRRKQDPAQETTLFTDSLDLHNLLKYEPRSKTGWTSNSQDQSPPLDITLAKAISLSARFPLISPHGNLRSLDGAIIDRVVDGGYFDNSGMLTALELSTAIESLSNGALKPILIQISNHPVSLEPPRGLAPRPQNKPDKKADDEIYTASTSRRKQPREPRFRCPEQSFINLTTTAAQRQILPELTAVTSALLNARVARGSHAIARAALHAKGRFIHFQVAGIKDELGANKKLSMSWWLSKSVQNALNNQVNWRRQLRADESTPVQQRLNPSFCAIQKFRRAQKAHWLSRKSTLRPPRRRHLMSNGFTRSRQ